MKTIENKVFDEERALYGSFHISLKKCSFDGPADGESALKESGDIIAEDVFSIFAILFGTMIKLL